MGCGLKKRREGKTSLAIGMAISTGKESLLVYYSLLEAVFYGIWSKVELGGCASYA